ncbi:MAG: ribulose-phosphate 3-epimerase, partial [Candidatus Limnocylindrales bacterium]
MRKIEVAASITTADFGNLYRVVRKLERAGVDRLHLDVMDGHFVPNITFGPDVCAAVRRLTDLPIDVHLMISEPARYLERFIAAGTDTITFHYEIDDSAHGKHATLARI